MLPFALFGLLGLALLLRSSWRLRSRERLAREPTSHRCRHARPSRSAAGGGARAGRLVPGRGRGAEPLQGHRAPLLRLGAGARARERWRERARSPSSSSRAGAARADRGLALTACAVAATVAAQVVLLHREHYMEWFIPVLVGGSRRGSVRAARRCAAWRCRRSPSRSCCCSSRRPPTRPPPGSRRSRARSRPPDPGTTPAPAPTASTRATIAIDRALADYVSTHDPGSRWALLTVASDTALR